MENQQTVFKSIKITAENASAIEAALLLVNGRATSHTYTNAKTIIDMALQTEKKLEKLEIAASSRSGAQFISVSGDSVANAYKSTRIATRVLLRRGSKDWFLTNIESATIWLSGGYQRLTLTAAQDEIVVAKIRKNYRVQAEA